MPRWPQHLPLMGPCQRALPLSRPCTWHPLPTDTHWRSSTGVRGEGQGRRRTCTWSKERKIRHAHKGAAYLTSCGAVQRGAAQFLLYLLPRPSPRRVQATRRAGDKHMLCCTRQGRWENSSPGFPPPARHHSAAPFAHHLASRLAPGTAHTAKAKVLSPKAHNTSPTTTTTTTSTAPGTHRPSTASQARSLSRSPCS